MGVDKLQVNNFLITITYLLNSATVLSAVQNKKIKSATAPKNLKPRKYALRKQGAVGIDQWDFLNEVPKLSTFVHVAEGMGALKGT